MKKKIFKKNRLVILALSVMIGVAGYLNFNAGKRDDLLRQKAKETNADAEVIVYNDDIALGDALSVDIEIIFCSIRNQVQSL